MDSGLAKHLGTKYDAAVKDVSVRTQAAKLLQPCTPCVMTKGVKVTTLLSTES